MTIPRTGQRPAPSTADPPCAARAAAPILAAQVLLFATAALAFLASTVAAFAAPPEIRLHGSNRVPQCVTPERLMSFLTARNTRLEPRFRDIAKWYRHHGDALGVRWDYAFFQMVIETNYLTYRRPDGRWGDVHPKQNNFAGIGATGGGVPGDRFPDVATGVLAQIQHLVAYSGQEIASPVAPRTALKQHDIIAASRQLARPVRFSDLARRWAADPRYGTSIEFIAETFRSQYCARGERPRDENAGRETLPWRRSSLGGPSADGDEWNATVAKGAIIEAPAPRAAVRTNVAAAAIEQKRHVIRTIWRRGDTSAPPRLAAGPAPVAPAPVRAARIDAVPAPFPVAATSAPAKADAPPPTIAAFEARDGMILSGLMGGLAGMARSIEAAVMSSNPERGDTIVAPKPSLALRN